MAKEPKPFYRKVKRRILRYDLDLLNKSLIFRIDLTIEDSKNNITTPVVPLYEARFQTGNVKDVPARPNDFDPRHLICKSQGAEGQLVERTVYIPYLPSTIEARQQIKQTINLESVACAEYHGERWDRGLEQRV
jgi:hypothetical protein